MMHGSPPCEKGAGSPPLRVGLLLDDVRLPRCFAEALDSIVASPCAHLELLVFRSSPPPATKRSQSRLSRVAEVLRDPRRRSLLFYQRYERWDRNRLAAKSAAADPLEEIDCTPMLEGIERLVVDPIIKGFVHRFPPDAIDAIRAQSLDVLVRFGFNILRGEILQAARYGIWSYHHGDNDFYRGGPPYFWELVEENPRSGVILQVLSEALDAGTVIAKGVYATEPGLSVSKNRLRPYWASVPFLGDKLRELHDHGWEQVLRRAPRPAAYQGKRRLYRTPTNGQMLRWLVPTVARKALARTYRREQLAHWRLAVRVGDCQIADGTELDGFRWIEPPAGRYHADPFLIDHQGKRWLFFEDYSYAERRAVIACAEVRADGEVGEGAPVLDSGSHLSYPYVFAWGSELFMIPESRAQRAVVLYRAVRFPYEWRRERQLFAGEAVDTSVWVGDGRIWFFVPRLEPRGGGVHLWLFSADEPAGDWRVHPASPISRDVRNARGAGAIFRQGEILVRPAQDGSRIYGYAFSLNQIVRLTEGEYEERPLRVVEPGCADWARGLGGTHSYARAPGLEIVDGFTWVPAR
jgi:hypothetical protein